jgi:hypothetical protein
MYIDNDLKPLIDERAQRGPFDSHNIVNDYCGRFPTEYHSQLETAERRAEQRAKRLKLKKKPNAVHSLHTSLGIRIARLCEASGLNRTRSRSRDINGQQSCCLSWSASSPC